MHRQSRLRLSLGRNTPNPFFSPMARCHVRVYPKIGGISVLRVIGSVNHARRPVSHALAWNTNSG
jgi:hypothetical protein